MSPACARHSPKAASTQRARAVAMIVGRDPDQLDEAGVCRAAIESTAENFSDGVVAPVFWFALLGLPGLDRLQGDQHRRFHDRPSHRAASSTSAGPRRGSTISSTSSRRGCPALLLAARCAGGGRRGRNARFKSCGATRTKHRSPNAGWPESAMAGALGLALAGPRLYRRAQRRRSLPQRRAARSRRQTTSAARSVCMVSACVLEGAVYAALALVV